MTKTVTDDMLMAYADGALDPEETQVVEAYLAENPEAQQLVDSLRSSAALVSAAFRQPIDEPVPDRLLETVHRGGARRAPLDMTGADRARRPRSFARGSRVSVKKYVLPLAAAIALAVGFGIGTVWDRVSPSVSQSLIALGPVKPDSALGAMLETRGSGETVAANPRQVMSVVATFRDGAGRACREFEVFDRQEAGAPLPSAAAVACREPNARWVVAGAAHVVSEDAQTSGYTPSGGRERDVLDGLLDVLGASTVLSPTEEASLLKSGWQK